MNASWSPGLARVMSAGESGASAGLLVLLAALVAGTVALVLLLVVVEVFRRRGGDDDGFDVRTLWRQAADARDPDPPIATPYLDEARRRMHVSRDNPTGHMTGHMTGHVTGHVTGHGAEDEDSDGAAPEAAPSPSRWTAASQDVAWRENGRRDEFSTDVVREAEQREQVARQQDAERVSAHAHAPEPEADTGSPATPTRRRMRRRQPPRTAAVRRSKSSSPRVPRPRASAGRLGDEGPGAGGAARAAPAKSGRPKGSLGRLARRGRAEAPPDPATPAKQTGPLGAGAKSARTGRPKPSRARVGSTSPSPARVARKRTAAEPGSTLVATGPERVIDLRRQAEVVAARSAAPVISAPVAPPGVRLPPAPPVVSAPAAPPAASPPETLSAEQVPLVRLTVDTLQRAVRVAVARDRLLVLRSEAPAPALPESVWEARAARACLLSLVPLLLLARALTPDWPGAGDRSLSGAAGMVAFALLAVIGSVWTWRVTAPPYLHFPGRERARQRGIARDSSVWEQVVVRLAAGVSPYDAWRACTSKPGDFPGAGHADPSIEDAVAAIRERRADIVREPGRLEGQVSTVTLLPFLTCLAPAIVLAVML